MNSRRWIKGLWNAYSEIGYSQPPNGNQYSWFAQKKNEETAYAFVVQTDHIEMPHLKITLDLPMGTFTRNFVGLDEVEKVAATRKNYCDMYNALKRLKSNSGTTARLIETNGGRYGAEDIKIKGRIINGNWQLVTMQGSLYGGFNIKFIRVENENNKTGA